MELYINETVSLSYATGEVHFVFLDEDNEQVITLLAYALKEAEKAGYKLDNLTSGFIHGWLEESEAVMARRLQQDEPERDRTVLNWVLLACFVIGACLLVWLFS